MIVPDASIIAAAVVDSRGAGRFARDLLHRHGGAAWPDFADVETVAVLRKRWTARALADADFLVAIDALAALPFSRYPARAFLGRAYELRANLTPYYAVYVALAEALDADLVTADRRLAAAPGIRCRVRVVTDPED